MDHFSWADIIQAALAPCLPCLRSSSSRADSNDGSGSRARPDLEGLLADVETDTEAETVSLHSNMGDRNKRRRKKKKNGRTKSVTLFGYDLFGRHPAIQLPESDDEDASEGRGRSRRSRSGQLTASSSSTLDSDAAPLDQSTIDQISAMQLQARIAEEEEEQRQKAERRQRRKERKEMKKLAAALALESAAAEGDFEGFQGSGPDAVHGSIPSSFMAGSSQGDSAEGRQEVLDVPADVDVEEDADADFGGELYAKRATSNNSDRGSDSRSRTSGTLSSSGDPASMYNHHYASQVPQQLSPGVPYNPDAYMHYQALEFQQYQQQGLEPVPKKKKKKSSGKSKSSRDSASSTSQSQSIPSPVTTFPDSHPDVAIPSPTPIMPQLDILSEGASGFPSAGLPSAGFGGIRRKNSDMGVFLARRGDE